MFHARALSSIQLYKYIDEYGDNFVLWCVGMYVFVCVGQIPTCHGTCVKVRKQPWVSVLSLFPACSLLHMLA